SRRRPKKRRLTRPKRLRSRRRLMRPRRLRSRRRPRNRRRIDSRILSLKSARGRLDARLAGSPAVSDVVAIPPGGRPLGRIALPPLQPVRGIRLVGLRVPCARSIWGQAPLLARGVVCPGLLRVRGDRLPGSLCPDVLAPLDQAREPDPAD